LRIRRPGWNKAKPSEIETPFLSAEAAAFPAGGSTITAVAKIKNQILIFLLINFPSFVKFARLKIAHAPVFIVSSALL
jgi:hypothetical protein